MNVYKGDWFADNNITSLNDVFSPVVCYTSASMSLSGLPIGENGATAMFKCDLCRQINGFPHILKQTYTRTIGQTARMITYERSQYAAATPSASNWSPWEVILTNSDLNSLLGGLCIVNKNLKNNGPGRTICFNGNNVGKTYAGGDSYYIAVDNSQAIHIGYQIGGSTVVTWASK